MRVAVPKEIKAEEYRVGLTPAGVSELCMQKHEVLVQRSAGAGVGFSDEDYQSAGAQIIDSAEQLYAKADLIVKVKEPQLSECALLQKGQLIFAFLHLAAARDITEALVRSGATCVAYETIVDAKGALPLLTPMSEIAGRLSIQAAAHALEKTWGGAGILLGGVPGVKPANVLVLGGGVVGLNAARMAMGLGADVTILDKSLSRLRTIDELFGGRIRTIFSNNKNLEELLPGSDAVIGAVLVPGASAPKLLTREDLQKLRPGSVLVDVAIDQGGCFATSRPTTHKNPLYSVENVLHYCVANIPGAVPRTSTLALTNATLPWVLELANNGERALVESKNFTGGPNILRGQLTHQAVAESLNLPWVPTASLL